MRRTRPRVGEVDAARAIDDQVVRPVERPALIVVGEHSCLLHRIDHADAGPSGLCGDNGAVQAAGEGIRIAVALEKHHSRAVIGDTLDAIDAILGKDQRTIR